MSENKKKVVRKMRTTFIKSIQNKEAEEELLINQKRKNNQKIKLTQTNIETNKKILLDSKKYKINQYFHHLQLTQANILLNEAKICEKLKQMENYQRNRLYSLLYKK